MEPTKMTPGEYFSQEGTKPILMKDFIVLTTPAGVVEYAKNRHGYHNAKPWSVLYSKNANDPWISLVCGEFGGHKGFDAVYVPASRITGALKKHPLLEDVMANLLDNKFTPRELADYLRKKAILFSDASAQAVVVTNFRSMVTTITAISEDTRQDNGSRRTLLEGTVKKSCDDFSMRISVPAFVGEGNINIDVEFLYDISGLGVTVTPFAPMLEKELSNEADRLITKYLEELKAVLTEDMKVPFMEVTQADE